MNRILSLLALPAALAALVVAAAPARAATATANVNVSASVNAACTMANATIAFGAYDPLNTNPNDNQGNLTVTCTKGVAATISLASGVRAMTSGTTSDTLSYELYSDSGRTQVWSTTAVSIPTGTGVAQTVTVYGRIPALQNVNIGSYTGSVVATLNY